MGEPKNDTLPLGNFDILPLEEFWKEAGWRIFGDPYSIKGKFKILSAIKINGVVVRHLSISTDRAPFPKGRRSMHASSLDINIWDYMQKSRSDGEDYLGNFSGFERVPVNRLHLSYYDRALSGLESIEDESLRGLDPMKARFSSIYETKLGRGQMILPVGMPPVISTEGIKELADLIQSEDFIGMTQTEAMSRLGICLPLAIDLSSSKEC